MGRGEKVLIGSNKNCETLAQFIVSILSEVNLGSNNFELVFYDAFILIHQWGPIQQQGFGEY